MAPAIGKRTLGMGKPQKNQQEKEINGRSKTIDYSDETGKYYLESRTNQRRTAQDKYSCKQKDYTKSI